MVNGKIRLLASVYIALCSVCLAVGLFILTGVALSDGPNVGRTLGTLGMPFLLLSIFYFIPGLAGGIGLLRGREWARIVIIVLSALVLFAIPVGPLFGGWGLWVLSRPRQSSTPRAPKPVRPPLPPLTAEQRSSMGGILQAMFGVACAFTVVIGTGYRLTHNPSSPIPDSYYYAAIIGLVIMLAIGIRALVRMPRSTWRLSSYHGFGRDGVFATPREAERILAKRVAELAADPIKRKYIERVKADEYWPDEQIAYAEDFTRLATCPHLQPIEAAMRAAGVTMRLTSLPTVRATCRVDPVALGSRFALPDSVRYAEMHVYDRSIHDPPVAFIQCDLCRWTIDVVHPSQAQPATPWFPAEPQGDPEVAQR